MKQNRKFLFNTVKREHDNYQWNELMNVKINMNQKNRIRCQDGLFTSITIILLLFYNIFNRGIKILRMLLVLTIPSQHVTLLILENSARDP